MINNCAGFIFQTGKLHQLNATAFTANTKDLRESRSSSEETVTVADKNGWDTIVSAREATITTTFSEFWFYRRVTLLL